MKEVIVRISRDGKNVKVEANGFTGEGCITATKALLDKFGGPQDTRHKDEFFVAEGVAQSETR